MNVYFVYRSNYYFPELNYLRTFKADSVLDWFKQNWHSAPSFDEAHSFARSLIGIDVYGFDSIFEAIGEHTLEPPKTTEELDLILADHLYVEGEISFRPHAIQVLTDDDELDVAYYIFDDHFLKEHKEHTAYLLQSVWHLPTAISDQPFRCTENCRELGPGGKGEGNVYCSFQSFYDSGGNLSDIAGTWKIDGVRLPQLAQFLGSEAPQRDPADYAWPSELLILRSQLLNAPESAGFDERTLLNQLIENHTSETNWQLSYSQMKDLGYQNPGLVYLERALKSAADYPVSEMDYQSAWEDREQLAMNRNDLLKDLEQWQISNDSSKSRVQVDEHIAQISVHTQNWHGMDLYNRWIIFDDLWASANEELANSILRYSNRWDVLTTD